MNTHRTDDALMALILGAMLLFVVGIGVDAQWAQVQDLRHAAAERLETVVAVWVQTAHQVLPAPAGLL